jgi:nucleoside-diphosphate-sugar epimerase
MGEVFMKIALITGPTGVLGSALTRKMAKEGIETYVVCHPGSKRTKNIINSPYIHKIECDLDNIKDLPKLIGKSCDVFFHLAWLGTQNNNNRLNMYMQNTNVKYTLDAVEAAHALQCKVFVGAGSQAEYGRIDGIIHPDSITKPISGYGMAKLCAGQMTRTMCKEYGIRHIWPRVVSTFGPNDAPKTLISVVIDKLLAGEKPSLTAGEQIWDYLYSDDAADAFYRMALKGKDGAVYVLGSGQTKPLKEFMKIIRDSINPTLPLGIGEIPYLKDQAMHLEADVRTLTADTGWKPSTSFQKGIETLIAIKQQEKKNVK